MVAAIVAVDINWGIGCGGNLLVDIPEDKKFFREKTKDSIVIMGRKTWDSLQIKPLPNRTNYIISRNSLSADENSHVITLEEAIQIIKSTTKEEKVFIIVAVKYINYCCRIAILYTQQKYIVDILLIHFSLIWISSEMNGK